MKFEWEQLDNDTYRAKVIGGWLVENHCCSSMCFVPDPGWVWVVDDED